MRDFKHIAGRKRPFRLRLFGRHRTNSLNSFKMQVEPKPDRKWLRYVLPCLAVILAAYPVGSLLFSARNAVSSVNKTPPPVTKVKPYGELTDGQSFRLGTEALHASRYEGERLVAPLADGGKMVYTFDQELQTRVMKVLESYRVPYGAFVAIEPKTGRILAMAGYSAADPSWADQSCYNLYPMASLFKIVTAAAALEQKKVNATTVMPFSGRLTSENPKYWDAPPPRKGRQGQQMDLTMAMGKSVNPVFGRLASDVVGRDSLMASAVLFGFNQPLFPETPVTPSVAQEPRDNLDLRRMGAGLSREVKISPLHAAALMAAIANDGTLMKPFLAEEIRNGKGEEIYSPKAQPLRRLVTPENASELGKMLSSTVSSGTSRKAFHDRRGRPKLATVDIAAKTGSINGINPTGHYSWFAAYAPANDPQIALVALVVNSDKWRIKASYVGEQALEAFFK
ncbi:penicillin-binding transpeptidase domain-containing protein [Geomobilimonas luticola]|uniref:Penicillin-binding protein n=1 Tax=Geomobilimonas luticola TaxID=1114878 RepID=A0ABS5SBE4_9BACT|nr:penicillin-binding transpeptidase domain-containing protein [Geomobilimonas luticola]MBT0652684.1 penicillin-binding protein [Geomobilimonas luticola]